MMLEHVAIWTRNPERARDFYVRWFGATHGPVYESRRRAGFRSYFLQFPHGQSRLEIMAVPALDDGLFGERVGLAHFAIAVGTREQVDAMVHVMRASDVVVRSAARETGDGYYEAVVEDADGNLVEIMETPKQQDREPADVVQ